MGLKVTTVTHTASDIVPGATVLLVTNADYDSGDETLVLTVYVGTNRIVKFARDGSIVWVSEAVALPTGGVPNPAQDRSRMLGVNYGLPSFGLLALGTGQAVVNQSASITGGFQHWTYDGLSDAVIISQQPSNVPTIKRIYINRLAAVDLSVADVVEAIAVRSGMEPADLDVSDIDLPLRGYILARPMSARDAIAPLASAHQFDAAEVDDTLLFVPRGGAVAATIAYDAMVREAPDANVLEEQRAQDAELPREVAVRYLDIERGWEQSSQAWRRPASPTPTMGSAATSAIDLPLPLTGDEAKTIARRMCVATWLPVSTRSIKSSSLPPVGFSPNRRALMTLVSLKTSRSPGDNSAGSSRNTRSTAGSVRPSSRREALRSAAGCCAISSTPFAISGASTYSWYASSRIKSTFAGTRARNASFCSPTSTVGRSAQRARQRRAEIGMLFQGSALFDSLTVEENVMAVVELRAKDMSEARATVTQLLTDLHIEHLRQAPAISLSGGERRRVEIARALASEPSFMLLAEPFAGIDPLAIADIREVISYLKQRGIGILITDHNVRETLGLTDRAYIVYAGEILTEGSPEEIVNDPDVRRLYLGEEFRL